MSDVTNPNIGLESHPHRFSTTVPERRRTLMGADLLLTALVHNKNKKLNWAAGRRAARKLDPEVLLARTEEVWGFNDGVTEARRQLNTLITQVKAEMKATTRDSYVLEIGTWRVHMRGGTSYGDDPTPGWTVFNDISYFPEVLKAMGFNLGAARWV